MASAARPSAKRVKPSPRHELLNRPLFRWRALHDVPSHFSKFRASCHILQAFCDELLE